MAEEPTNDPAPNPEPPADPTPPTPSPTPEPPEPNGPRDDSKPDDGRTKWERFARQHEKQAKQATADKAAADQARQEADDARKAAEAKQSELLDGIAAALGIKKEEETVDPAALERTINDRDRRIVDLQAQVQAQTEDHAKLLRAKEVELAAWRAAAKHGANPLALLDRRSFLGVIEPMDPGTETFATDLETAVKKAIEDDPTLKASPVPTPGAAGIGSKGGTDIPNTAPGVARIRAAYGGSG